MTNRDKFLNSITNLNLASIIRDEAGKNGCSACPINYKCKGHKSYADCVSKISKWLGDKA